MCSDLLAKKIKLKFYQVKSHISYDLKSKSGAYEKSFSKVQRLVMFGTYFR